MTGPDGNHSVGTHPASLLADLASGFSRLIRGEIALARAETSAALRDAARGVAKLAIAAVIGITALNLLAGAAVAGLVHLGLSPAWAAVALAAALLLVAFGLVQTGLRALDPENLAPKRALRNLRRDAETLKTMVSENGNA